MLLVRANFVATSLAVLWSESADPSRLPGTYLANALIALYESPTIRTQSFRRRAAG
jgi:hypothetical protein